MSTLASFMRASFPLIDERITVPAAGGLSFTHRALPSGSQPVTSGSLQIVSNAGTADIVATVVVHGSRAGLADNAKLVRVDGAAHQLELSTGGLGWMSGLKDKLFVDVTIAVPPTGAGAISVRGMSLPMVATGLHTDGDIVLHNGSGAMRIEGLAARHASVEAGAGSITFTHAIDAASLTVSAHSAHVAFEHSPGAVYTLAERLVVDTQSGGVALAPAALAAREVALSTQSGSASVRTAQLDAAQLSVTTSSGGVKVSVSLKEGEKWSGLASSITTSSGSVVARFEKWAGALEVKTGSGSKSVKGEGLRAVSGEKEGKWVKEGGASEAVFKTGSGSVKIEVL